MKKVTCIIISLIVLVCSLFVTVQAQQDYLYGDANYDGNVNAYDALLVLQFSVYNQYYYELNPNGIQWIYEITQESTPTLYLLDVNLDYRVDAIDALFILQHSVGIIQEFPAQA